jgi:hypothetical protein
MNDIKGLWCCESSWCGWSKRPNHGEGELLPTTAKDNN